MAGDLTDTGTLYSPLVGLIFIFNLIVGTGALTMPSAFDAAGWLLSLILVILLAFASYLTVTFMIESMAAANAVRRWKRLEALKNEILNAAEPDIRYYSDINQAGESYHSEGLINTTDDVNSLYSETSPLIGHSYVNAHSSNSNPIHYYEISERVEMGQMAQMFFNKAGYILFHICMCVYLYGDLAIYGAAVPKSLRDVACTHKPAPINGSRECNRSLTEVDMCWDGVPLTRMNVYRIFLSVFALTLGSFTFFNVQKTTLLQIFTTIMRWLAFLTMIALACIRLSKHEGEGDPALFDISGVPTLFGVCVYSFMCHHSLPSLVTPIRNKQGILRLFAGDYVLILAFYVLLSFTGIFSFKDLKDLYTLNFFHNDCDHGAAITSFVPVQYFLALFPVFTLSTNFPIIAITLRNNLKSLFLKEDRGYPFAIDRLLFPLMTLIPPVLVALVTNKVDILVGVTGSYAGVGIQYVVPAALVLYSRRQAREVINVDIRNKHASPFTHTAWIVGVLVWAALCVTFVTVHHVIIGS